MTRRCPAILIGGVSSGVGKTSLTLGIVRAMVRRGLAVQTFKVGPDFLDPSYLRLASGHPCYNLDGWMTSRQYVQQLFARVTADADVAVIEGVMGLFDGASPTGLEGSSAEIALWLDAPVLLVANAHGAARSFAAVVKGFAQFEPGLGLLGVIANHCGSQRHRAWLAESLLAAGTAPLAGAVPRGELPTLQSRHLGLLTADRQSLPDETINQLADACEKHLDMAAILASARIESNAQASTDLQSMAEPVQQQTAMLRPARIAVARDEAFHFYYPDNLEMLESFGAELVEFSPLADRHLPDGVGGVYLGGGYPEIHAPALAANQTMLADIRDHVAQGKALYAECGGLMYLARTIVALDGTVSALAGVLPIETAMLGKLKSLGYVSATTSAAHPWRGSNGSEAIVLRGHEFHYSQITSDAAAQEGWSAAYVIRRRDGRETIEGYAKGRVVASYVHAHFASCPPAARQFVDLSRET